MRGPIAVSSAVTSELRGEIECVKEGDRDVAANEIIAFALFRGRVFYLIQCLGKLLVLSVLQLIYSTGIYCSFSHFKHTGRLLSIYY